ncbi:hypothetical protein KY334_06355 [Candidatus Woesearchaeota archaeon]|nr:hypothetical protein [Candidatus Woesearchaeota archaeon]
MKLLKVAIMIFLLVGAFIIYKANDTDFSETQDRNKFIFKFSRWILDLGKNTFKITANAVSTAKDLEWLPEANETIEDNITNSSEE